MKNEQKIKELNITLCQDKKMLDYAKCKIGWLKDTLDKIKLVEECGVDLKDINDNVKFFKQQLMDHEKYITDIEHNILVIKYLLFKCGDHINGEKMD